MGEYKGKRQTVTFPVKLHNVLTKTAKAETRTVSQMVVVLCQEALTARGIEVSEFIEED